VFARPESLDTAVTSIRRELAARPEAPLVVDGKGRAELLDQDYESAIPFLESQLGGQTESRCNGGFSYRCSTAH
jgi:hypothetical protein